MSPQPRVAQKYYSKNNPESVAEISKALRVETTLPLLTGQSSKLPEKASDSGAPTNREAFTKFATSIGIATTYGTLHLATPSHKPQNTAKKDLETIIGFIGTKEFLDCLKPLEEKLAQNNQNCKLTPALIFAGPNLLVVGPSENEQDNQNLDEIQNNLRIALEFHTEAGKQPLIFQLTILAISEAIKQELLYLNEIDEEKLLELFLDPALNSKILQFGSRSSLHNIIMLFGPEIGLENISSSLRADYYKNLKALESRTANPSGSDSLALQTAILACMIACAGKTRQPFFLDERNAEKFGYEVEKTPNKDPKPQSASKAKEPLMAKEPSIRLLD